MRRADRIGRGQRGGAVHLYVVLGRGDADPGNFGVLSRQRGCAGPGRRIIAAAQEERFTRKKHDARFPRSAIEYCLQAGGIKLDAIDYVVFYEKPFLKFERLLET